MLPDRPVTILIAALGGEGGGVLADWVIAAARRRGYPVQGTSIPGVAQRTGATTYYVEIYPAAGLPDAELPIMTLAPAPGHVDVVIASELLEAARAMTGGYVTSERTTLVASTHRVYTVAEKMQMGDGRMDGERIAAAAHKLARRAILFDMQRCAQDSGAMINAVMLGALAASAALPLDRAACEEAIRSAGKGVEASLAGFELGFRRALAPHGAASDIEAGAMPAAPIERIRAGFPPPAHRMIELGYARLVDFQDVRYAELYLDRLVPIARRGAKGDGPASGFRLANETARFLALWMAYEDVIRVADLKTRKSRFERVRAEVQAKTDEPVRIVEYLKPGVDELAAMLPPALARRLLRWCERHGLTHRINCGMHVDSTSISGFLMLRLLGALRPLRRYTSRYQDEQLLIERWLNAVTAAAERTPALALEIALCGRLIKGYGDTHRRGRDNFEHIMNVLVDGAEARPPEASIAAIRAAREAALADPEGRALDGALVAAGAVPRPLRARPIHFHRRPAGAARRVA